MSTPSISSPKATGQAGAFFEQNVTSYWLAQLLVGAIPPVLINTTVVEASFQTEHLGWNTDDFLVTCKGPGGALHKLAGQVKLNFSVSSTDDECKKAILDFWKDFLSPERFAPARDRLLLVVQRGTDVLLKNFGGLLECARASQDGIDFQRRLSIPGFIAKRASQYCTDICDIVSRHEGRAISHVDIWPFIKALHLLSLDLDTTTRQTEAHIKALLAYAISEGDPLHVAQTSWTALLQIASTAMSQAQTLRHGDFPAELRQIHAPVGVQEEKIIRALREHTQPVLRKIRSTIGPTFHFDRLALTQSILDEFDRAQVVVVSGPAGSGKSAIGKDVAARMSNDHFVFGFRVEEFAQPHIDATLQSAQIPGNATALRAILGAQGRKFLLVESVERLLERTTRDAFSDLMAEASADPDMCLLLTCRDYSTELVRASFLRPSGLNHSVIPVPPLSDDELTTVALAVPKLDIPLKSAQLRNILRNPYFLDKACEMPWTQDRALPENERDFRKLFWREIVGGDSGPANTLSRRREVALQQIAVRRARALSEYVSTNTLDLEAVTSLRKDSIVESRDANISYVATAHDVLEDWAILQWLDELHLSDASLLQDIAASVDTHPAIRRAYRKWLAELLERDPSSADRIFLAATSTSAFSPQFLDDTLVSLLKAPLAPELLKRHESQILANNHSILKRIVHLLRVACVATPDWLRGASGFGSIFNVPDGIAWASVLSLVEQGLPNFEDRDQMLLLGLIEDAVRGVSFSTPTPDGATSIAVIGYSLLPSFNNYHSDNPLDRLLKVLAKIPSVDPERFESSLRSTSIPGQRRDRIAEEFQNLLFSGTNGNFAARSLPDLMVSVAEDYLLLKDEDLRRDRYRDFSTDISVFFGIKDLRFEYLPASAIRGPWASLLRYHTNTALALYHKVFNHSIEWYVHPRVHDRLEPAESFDLTFKDGTLIKQFGNTRLWNCYRGTHVSPYVLQTMLMALEQWLMDVGQSYPEHLDNLLLRILRQSQSASLSAVIASIAIAFPKHAGETILVLLSVPEFISLDRVRAVSEAQARSLNNLFPDLQADKKIYYKERDVANDLPHRKHDLEWAVATLQLGPLKARVHEILDHHLAKLPKGSERSKAQLLWHLALKRMDLREYVISEVVEKPSAPDIDSKDSTATYIRLEPKAADPDVQRMVEESARAASAQNALLEIWMWGLSAFKNESKNKDKWKETLAAAKSVSRDDRDDLGGRNGPGFVAAVCVRDYWDELSHEDRSWCSNVVCEEVLRQADNWNQTARIQRYEMSADRACASVLGVLLTREAAGSLRLRITEALAAAITHPVEEVRWNATWGLNDAVWTADPQVPTACIAAIAREAIRLDDLWDKPNRPWQPADIETADATIANEIRRTFWEALESPEKIYTSLQMSGWFGSKAVARILTVYAFVPDSSLGLAAFEKASVDLVGEWNSRKDDRGHNRHYEEEQVVLARIKEVVLSTTKQNALRILNPILNAVDDHPREVHSFVESLTALQDRRPQTVQYWYLWGLFAEKVKAAKWISRLDRTHPDDDGMLRAIFLTSWWKDNVRHWKSLEGYDHHIHALFSALPVAPIVLDSYLRFLYHIGEQSIPAAFKGISTFVKKGSAQSLLRDSNSIFLLEVLLQRKVYGRPLELKQDAALRDAVVFLLDTLVECGSSAAFRMRDDFVTPAS